MSADPYSTNHAVQIAALIILYKPEEVVIAGILSYIDQVKYLYIVDNTDESDNHEDYLIHKIANKQKIRILHSGENIGIAKGINLGLEQATEDGIEWLMTMDQDSSFSQGQLDNYFDAFQEALQQHSFGLFALQHNKKFFKKENCPSYYNDEIAMTSGSIVNVHQAMEVNGFNEKLFIDEVDHEFCYRLIASGSSILKTDCAYLRHSLGRSQVSYFGYQFRSYPPERLYYMVRNHLYVKKHYNKKYSTVLAKRQKYILGFIIKQIVNNKNPWLSLKYVLKGLYDYKQNKMGRLQTSGYSSGQ